MNKIWDVMQEIIEPLRPRVTITLKDMERELWKIFVNDPERGARAIGRMYGNVFKMKEAAYDKGINSFVAALIEEAEEQLEDNAADAFKVRRAAAREEERRNSRFDR